MKNIDVLKRFLNRETGKTMHLKSNGCELVNYDTVIAYWNNGKLYINVTKYSNTTSKIQSQLKQLAYDFVEYEGNQRFFNYAVGQHQF